MKNFCGKTFSSHLLEQFEANLTVRKCYESNILAVSSFILLLRVIVSEKCRFDSGPVDSV